MNNVPEERRGDGPVCGKCKSQLLPSSPIVLTDSNFGHYISRTELPVLVDFWASWCGPCHAMSPEFERAAMGLVTEAILAKVNTESARQTAAAYRIGSIPTLVGFLNGREIGRQSGVRNAAEIVRWLRSLIVSN